MKSKERDKKQDERRFDVNLKSRTVAPPIAPVVNIAALIQLTTGHLKEQHKHVKHKKHKKDVMDEVKLTLVLALSRSVSKHKIRVVFDCSAEYDGISLNNQLLQGLDLTNSSVGVFLRFPKEPFLIIRAIEATYCQVRVPEHRRKYLRLSYWPRGDLKQRNWKSMKRTFMCSVLFRQWALLSPHNQ